MANFAIIGVGGYIAPKHLQAIKDTGSQVTACYDINDSVGIIDSYFPDAHFFTEFERFDRHVSKTDLDYMTVCSPNHLHDYHVRFALRSGCNVICEKPLVLNPINARTLLVEQKIRNKKVSCILQLRLHPAIVDLKKMVDESDSIHDIDLTYITARGNWYGVSWKGNEEKSGGIATNIGIHFFDMLLWVFGAVKKSSVMSTSGTTMSGMLELEKANVRWLLSTDKNLIGGARAFRKMVVDGAEIDFTEGFTDLHTESYKEILKGNGFGIEDALPAIELVWDIRHQKQLV